MRRPSCSTCDRFRTLVCIKLNRCRKSRKLALSEKLGGVPPLLQTHSRHARRLLWIRGAIAKAAEPRFEDQVMAQALKAGDMVQLKSGGPRCR
jgi:hypothetical protein